MLRLRKLCCCFAGDGISEGHEQEMKNSNTNETVMTIAKTNLTTRRKEEYQKKLIISVIETMHLVIGNEYEIFPTGLENSKRAIKDSCVYAGTLEKQGNLIVNDILLPEDEKGAGKRHFMIKYNKEKQNYFLKDMGDGMGTFIRIEQPLKLKNSYIVSFGDSHMMVNIENNLLTIRFVEGPKADHKSTYSPEDSPIKIGRFNDCDIRFEDTSLSRNHCYMYYADAWMIMDGDGKKLSTNGTWLFVEQFFEFYDGLVFKAGESLFKAKITQDFNNDCNV
ncbi:hypothetical protein SteCoe_36043 [Stentor coeruleus]|uniref:FHA domain-containing protein n=1 Tax=Stentor coeruleus TaxID=5963 RepID=A0A1R2AQY5_9CILI|nr:hypothetical protein SteCoe_36043 [Stentor coeruleus]